jgi:hypothetical protein
LFGESLRNYNFVFGRGVWKLWAFQSLRVFVGVFLQLYVFKIHIHCWSLVFISCLF